MVSDSLLRVEIGNSDSGEEYLRRRTRNCGNQIAIWPRNLINFITVAMQIPVVLTCPPETCGPCMYQAVRAIRFTVLV